MGRLDGRRSSLRVLNGGRLATPASLDALLESDGRRLQERDCLRMHAQRGHLLCSALLVPLGRLAPQLVRCLHVRRSQNCADSTIYILMPWNDYRHDYGGDNGSGDDHCCCNNGYRRNQYHNCGRHDHSSSGHYHDCGRCDDNGISADHNDSSNYHDNASDDDGVCIHHCVPCVHQRRQPPLGPARPRGPRRLRFCILRWLQLSSCCACLRCCDFEVERGCPCERHAETRNLNL
jgi:hypothetical protein